MTETQIKFEAWAVVELFGHQRTAGRISEQAIGGETFIRIDIPRGDGEYTRLLGKGAIYAINICEEAIAREWAKRVPEPFYSYVAVAPAALPPPRGADPEELEPAGGTDPDDDVDPDHDAAPFE